MSIPYVKFFPSDWKAGCSNLSPIEELIYLKVCIENWDTGKPLTEENLARAMRGHSDGIADALQYLVDEQKIEKNEHGFFNARAMNTHEEAVKRHNDASKAASKRWKNKKQSDNAGALKAHKPRICQPEPEPEPIKKNKQKKFDEFWKTYPRKIGKKRALVAYENSLTNTVTEDKIIRAAKSYADHIRKEKTEEQYIAHPTTWLNQGRWDDEYGTTKPKGRMI